AKIHAQLPDTQIVYISQSATPSRWGERQAYKNLNDMVLELTKKTPYLKYVETYDFVLTPDGQIRKDLFISDNQHFNAEGNRLMAERVRPVLESSFAR